MDDIISIDISTTTPSDSPQQVTTQAVTTPTGQSTSPAVEPDIDALAEAVAASRMCTRDAVHKVVPRAKAPPRKPRKPKEQLAAYKHLMSTKERQKRAREIREEEARQKRAGVDCGSAFVELSQQTHNDSPNVTRNNPRKYEHGWTRDATIRTLCAIIARPPNSAAQLDAIRQLTMLEGWGPVDTDAVQVTPADAQRLRERYLLAIRRELPPGGLRITCVTADECESYTASSIEDAIDWLGHTICCGDGPKLETITGAKIDGDAQLVE